MTTVKYAVSAYTADGTTTDYLITWDYLDEDHIAVYVDGTSNADPTANHTFTKLNNTTLRITDGIGGAVVSGADIEIRRETPLLTRAITFADGSALLAEDLNKNSDYLLYSMQEVLDTVDAAAQDGALAAEVATEALRDEAQVIRDEAEVLKDTTEGFKNTAGTYLATVQSDATDADNHRIAAAASETAAAASEVASAASEVAAAASEAASAASEAASAASETAAATSETNAAASETAAAASETAAAASETAAATSEANAAASYDNFDDRYLGAKSTIPTVDNDGDALLVGALYWNDVSDAMYVWNGSSWDTLPTSIGIADGATSTQLTLSDTLLSSAQPFEVHNPLMTTLGSSTPELANVKLGIRPDTGTYLGIDDNQIAAVNGTTLHLDAFGNTTDGIETEILLRTRNASGSLTTSATVTPDGLSTTSLTTNLIQGRGNIIEYRADSDESSTGSEGHFFYENDGNAPVGGFYNNDFYVQDNLNVGRYYLADGTNQYKTDGMSSLTVYSSDGTTGPAAYKNYTQINSRNSTDPDYGLIMASSAYVESQTPDTTETDQHAFLLDNGGRIWAWQSFFAGRTRRGDSGTTSNYRVGDHSFNAYSNTGGTHGEASSNGYTQIVGRETANSDDVFVSYSAGSMRIEFDASGNGRFDGGADISSADYAEYFEWEDGNPDDEDRRGYPVVLVADGKIRIATEQDDDAEFLGIVSVEAAVVGDSAWAAWTGRYKKDKFGARVKEDYTMYNWGQKENPEDPWEHSHTIESAELNKLTIPEDAEVIVKQRPVYADDYDSDIEYTPRRERVEWEAIGMLGKLPLYKGQPTKSTWRKLYDLSDETEMWLVR